jgi:hypothetical protein
MTISKNFLVNAATGEEIVRDYTPDELVQQTIDVATQKAKVEAEAQAALDKTALLAKLGISADEAKLLLS